MGDRSLGPQGADRILNLGDKIAIAAPRNHIVDGGITTLNAGGEEFDFPIEITERVIYKYGEDYEELDDTLFTIPFGAESIDFSNLIYDLINVQIPMKKLHPKFQEEEDEFDVDALYPIACQETQL